MISSRWSRAPRLGFLAGAAVFGGLILLPWWRNHALLRDFYDYGLVMAAAGRMEAGERPYVDFLTPIQTLHFLLAQGAERIWGARYLSLTYANAVAMVAALAGLVALLARRCGGGTALVLAAAVVVASFGQHTIVWHNALGVLWLAGAMWCAALPPERGAWRVLQFAGMLGALWLGGMTKLTYQVAGLAFVLLFTVRAVARGEVGRGAGALIGLGVLVCGVVAPVVTELLYTGASFEVWRENVIELAASRRELLLRGLMPRFYWRTPHDYYAGAGFPFVGGWGVLLVMGVAWTLWRARRRDGAGQGVWLGCATAGAVVCGVVLLATNFEIAHMAGAAWLVLATGLVLAFARGREGQRVLAVGAVTLLVPAWWSAWIGARALWGRGELVREAFVTADELPPRFSYLRGTRIESGMRDTLLGFDEYVAGTNENGIYLVHGAEWMVRAAPAARHRGLPLWLHDGTTYSEKNAWIINGRLAHGGGIETIAAFEAWNHWHFGAAEMLKQAWTGPRRVGPHLMFYHLQPAVDRPLSLPAEFATRTGSNVYARRMTVAEGKVALRIRKDGPYLEQPSGSVVTLEFPVRSLRGEMVAELTEPVSAPVAVTFRVMEIEGKGVLAERRISLSNEASSWIGNFDVEGGGRAMSLEMVTSSREAAAGWRKLRTSGTDAAEEAVPGPLDAGLKALAPNPEWAAALMALTEGTVPRLAAFGIDGGPDMREGVRELFVHAPGEVWLRVEGGATRVTGEGGLRGHAWAQADSLPGAIMRVVFCNEGRLEVLFEKELRPKTRDEDRLPQRFDVELPEQAGWIALVVVSVDPSTHAWGHAWWRGVRIE